MFRQWLVSVLTLALFAGVLGVVAAGLTGLLVYRSYASDLKSPQDTINSKFVGPSLAFDRNGQQLGEYVDPNGGLRDPVPLDQISPYVVAATVATEDASFYTNPGVNFNGLARAAWQNLLPFGGGGFFGGSGGSSITQQLVKNIYITQSAWNDTSVTSKIDRKLKESVIALELKRKYDNNQIMDWYLNQIFYGRNAYGIEAAAHQFFNKKASELTLAEAAYLAGLPQAPHYRRDPAPPQRQQDVLDLMIKHLDDVNKI